MLFIVILFKIACASVRIRTPDMKTYVEYAPLMNYNGTINQDFYIDYPT
jgi:hypothetical protein